MKTYKRILTLLLVAIVTLGVSAQSLKEQFQNMVESDPQLKAMVIKSIAKAKAINPDPATNPGQSLEDYYKFIDWSEKCMPFEIVKEPTGSSLYNRIDQGVCYCYFVFDQPLDELKGKGYYYNSLQYHEPIRSWLINYAKEYGRFLNTEASWNDEYLKAAMAEKRFNMDKGWYEPSKNWRTFNEFFHRRLSSPSVRPIASPNDNSIVTMPADSKPQGIWEIDANSNIKQHGGVIVKSARGVSVKELVGEGSAYCNAFADGTLIHTFLNVDDYHRFHFPMNGTIVDLSIIPGDDAAGGITIWDAKTKSYILESEVPGWQMFETRGLIILKTEQFGIVGILPIGMSQISSVNFEPNLHAGVTVKKGDPMGWFDFGGSDIVMLFQKDVNVKMIADQLQDGTYPHAYTGNAFAKLTKK